MAHRLLACSGQTRGVHGGRAPRKRSANDCACVIQRLAQCHAARVVVRKMCAERWWRSNVRVDGRFITIYTDSVNGTQLWARPVTFVHDIDFEVAEEARRKENERLDALVRRRVDFELGIKRKLRAVAESREQLREHYLVALLRIGEGAFRDSDLGDDLSDVIARELGRVHGESTSNQPEAASGGPATAKGLQRLTAEALKRKAVIWRAARLEEEAEREKAVHAEMDEFRKRNLELYVTEYGKRRRSCALSFPTLPSLYSLARPARLCSPNALVLALLLCADSRDAKTKGTTNSARWCSTWREKHAWRWPRVPTRRLDSLSN